MERVKIQLPPHFAFSTNLPIRITDLNYGGHVGNNTFLSLIHEARVQFLQSHGYSELSVEGCGLIMCDAAIEFKQELSYGQVVTIQVTAANFTKLGFDIYYQLFTTDANGKLCLAGKAKTGMLCFDYTLKKKVSLPEIAASKLGGNSNTTLA